ncbi:MAG TPA: hypothetical protein VFJ59_02315 [Pseudolabrys sp.]|nr:hypothetical protein [Pseudolabrys sp.]
MMRKPSLFVLLTLTVALSAVSAYAQSDIMVPDKGDKAEKPEPWLAPKYRSPRGTVKRVTIPKSTIVQPPSAAVPPPIVVPQTGRVLPNLPTVSGSGRGGAETYQDRAARCAHQAGVYGQAAGDRNTYIGTCINQ